MLTVLRIELFKIFKRPRTYISFIAIAAIVLLIQFAFYADGNAYVSFMLQSINSSFSVEGNILNGYLICFIVLNTLLIHVPLLIALVAADMIAGEANMGTLRLIASKPVSRSTLIMSKFLASTIYTMMLLVWMAILSLFLSMIVFGTGDLMIFKSEEIIIHPENDIFWRYFYAFGFAAIAMTTVAALALFLSVFAENSIGPIVTTMSVIIFLTILSSLDLPMFDPIRPYIFTSHMLGWKGFFDNPIQYDSVYKSAGVLLAHIVLFLGGALVGFGKKEIVS